MMRPFCLLVGTICCWSLLVFSVEAQLGDSNAHNTSPLVVVVMDPLSDRLACDCVEGYAQRKYEYLGEYLESRLDRKVEVYWGNSIALALKDVKADPESVVRADLVIGKHSVIADESKRSNLALEPFAHLTDLNGSTQQTGLVVVRGLDPALMVEDLVGYRVIFGPANCDEKSAAPEKLFRDAEVQLPEKLETADACSVAAQQILESPAEEKIAAVISSYAAPLLEGCGTINKGDLRVVGESEPVPFITAFVNRQLSAGAQAELLEILLAVEQDQDLLKVLETKNGFVRVASESSKPDLDRDQGSALDPSSLSRDSATQKKTR